MIWCSSRLTLRGSVPLLQRVQPRGRCSSGVCKTNGIASRQPTPFSLQSPPRGQQTREDRLPPLHLNTITCRITHQEYRSQFFFSLSISILKQSCRRMRTRRTQPGRGSRTADLTEFENGLPPPDPWDVPRNVREELNDVLNSSAEHSPTQPVVPPVVAPKPTSRPSSGSISGQTVS